MTFSRGACTLFFLAFLLSPFAKSSFPTSFESEIPEEKSYARLGLSQQSFLSSSFPLADRNYPLALGEFKKDNESDAVRFEAYGRLSLNKPALTTANIRELYYQSKFDDNEVRIGRSLWNWNFIESEFQLGVWEPLFKAETLRRQTQGLTGIFWNAENGNNEIMLFISPIFIPHQGPSYVINGRGQFESVNPWFFSPPRKIKLFPTSTNESDIEYNIKRPPDSEILYNTTAGLWYQRILSENFKSTFTFMSKPDNQLLLAFQGGYNTGTDRGEVNIYPKLQRQNLYSVQFDWQQPSALWQATYAHIDYDRIYDDPTLTYTKFRKDVDIGSARVEVPWNVFKFSASYLRTTIRELNDVGPLAFRRAATTPQLPLTEALRVGTTINLPVGSLDAVQSGLYYLWSQRNQLEQISFDLRGKWQQKLVLFTKLELLKAAELTSENTNEISQSAINDFVEVGALYEF